MIKRRRFVLNRIVLIGIGFAIALALLWLLLSYSNFNGDWLQTGIPHALVHFTETPTLKP